MKDLLLWMIETWSLYRMFILLGTAAVVSADESVSKECISSHCSRSFWLTPLCVASALHH